MSKLDDLRTIVDAMTPGCWRREESLVCGPSSRGVDIADCSLGAETDDPEWTGAIADATGIVALRNHATALLDLVDAVDSFLTANDAQLPGDRYYIPRAHAVERLRDARKRLEDLS